MKKALSIILAIIMVASVLPLAFAAETETVVLYTNDVHCAIDDYAVLAAYKAQLEADGKNVVLVDAGDAIQGEIIGALTEGEAVVDLMNAVGYDYAVPGNHEFDYGMEVFLDLAQNKAEYEYISSNFHYLPRADSVFSPYAIEDFGSCQIAFVGISTPDTITSSTPEYFKDENGNYVYGFPLYPGGMTNEALYENVQESVDGAIAGGADVVVAVGHTGILGSNEGWKSTDIIANTDGIDYFIDAHSHETIEGDIYKNKNDEDVALTSTGEKFANFGALTISGSDASFELINPDDVDVDAMSETAKTAYSTVKAKIDGYNDDIAYLYEEIGTSEAELIIYDDDGNRIVRCQETNAGDFVADAYRAVTGADVAIANGGGIRAEVEIGSVSRKNLMDVNSFNNDMCVLEVTGQQLIDVLEHGARKCPELLGSFFQVSGMTFEIHTYRESPVICDQLDNFIGIDAAKERRVENVLIGGEPVDLGATYTLAGSTYVLLQGGDGLTMLEGSTVVQKEGLPCDSEMLIKYFTEDLGGVIPADMYGNPDGDGRITIIDGNTVEIEHDYEISYGETITVQAPLFDSGEYAYIKFVPENDSKYILESNTDVLDPVCILYDESGSELENNDDGIDRNFRVEHYFYAGETYYFAVQIYSKDEGNEFEVTLRCGHNYENSVCGICGNVCDHENADGVLGFCGCGNVYLGKDIKAGDSENFLYENGIDAYFRFVPEETGNYVFASVSDTEYGDPLCHVFGSDLEYIASSDDVIGYDFVLVYYFEKGETYYFEVTNYCEDEACTLKFERSAHTVNGVKHELYLDEGYTSSCTEHGCSAGFYCEDCEEFVWGHEELPFEHNDWDENGICDDCGADIYTFWEKIALWFDNLFMQIKEFFAGIIFSITILFM